MIQVDTILCPTDFSEPSRAATEYALELARRFDARLQLLFVVENPVLYSPALGGYVPKAEDLERFAQTALDNWVLPDDAAGIEIERRWVHGHPYAQIVGEAREHDVDLIVMGTHGRGFLPHLLLGSVAERVVRYAPCPVLTVRSKELSVES